MPSRHRTAFLPALPFVHPRHSNTSHRHSSSPRRPTQAVTDPLSPPQNGPAPPSVSPSAQPRNDFCTLNPPHTLPPILLIHCGGTFGMDPTTSFTPSGDLRSGGTYKPGLQPGRLLTDLVGHFPELAHIANLQLHVAMNLDSSRIQPRHWQEIALLLHENRDHFTAFVIIHGTDTLSYTGSALSLMLEGFDRAVVLTGSQLPMRMPRSDARQNLVDAVCVAAAGVLKEVAICFGGLLLRANRAQKTASSAYRAFSSPDYPPLATLGVGLHWNYDALYRGRSLYRPRFRLETNVIRVPVVPGVHPDVAIGDLGERGVKGAVVETFGVGNMPDLDEHGWIEWMTRQREGGVELLVASQCASGPLDPVLYRSGVAAVEVGVRVTKRMTVETAVVKMMLCLAHNDLDVTEEVAGEL